MTGSTPGLVRLVVCAPNRRLELAVPDQLPVAHLLPGLLRQAGQELAEAGQVHGGWVLRRSDGSRLAAGSSCAVQQVRDGEVLHLVPRQLSWPEAGYDDIVEAIAASARRRGARWSGAATRLAGLGLAGAALLVGLVAALATGPPWTVTATLLLLTTGGLLLVGTLLARALGDAGAGAVVAAAALPYAFAGGLVLLAGESLPRIGAPHLLTGSAALVVAGVAGYLGTGEYGRLFVAAVTAAGAGTAGAVLALLFPGIGVAGAAAAVAGGGLLVSPLVPAVAIRVGRIPLPDLPRTVEDLVDDRPPPDRRSVEQATDRTDEVLTGGLLGVAVGGAAALALLVLTGAGGLAPVLAAVVSVAFLLRSRFHVAVRHRVPLLALGAAGLALVAVAAGTDGGPDRVVLLLPATAALALLALVAGRAYQRRPPSPRLGRLADIGDVVLTLAVVPLAAEVLGLYAYVRGLAG